MRIVGISCLLILILTACAQRASQASTIRAVHPVSRLVDAALGPGTASASLLVEPDDGVTPVIKSIDHAQNRIFVSAYILSQKRIIRALERAEAQGVDVYVLLDKTPFGIVGQPQLVYSQLNAAGIAVRWAPAWFQYSHAKFMVLDDRTLILSSANFTLAGFAHDRDFVLFDSSPPDVREADNIFRADWDRIAPALTDPNLLVSPSNARTKLNQLIGRAHFSLDLYSEEVLDPGIVSRLARDARRGIQVRVIATTVSAAARRILTAAGALVKSGTASAQSLYVHAKAIVVDSRIAFLGSENISTTSLNDNRELGILVRDPYVVGRLELTFSNDWKTLR